MNQEIEFETIQNLFFMIYNSISAYLCVSLKKLSKNIQLSLNERTLNSQKIRMAYSNRRIDRLILQYIVLKWKKSKMKISNVPIKLQNVW